MIDLKYRTISGALNIKKARVILDSGYLHFWEKDGSHFKRKASELKRKSVKTHTAMLDEGKITMKRGCGCGMPMRIRMTRDGNRLLSKVS